MNSKSRQIQVLLCDKVRKAAKHNYFSALTASAALFKVTRFLLGRKRPEKYLQGHPEDHLRQLPHEVIRICSELDPVG